MRVRLTKKILYIIDKLKIFLFEKSKHDIIRYQRYTEALLLTILFKVSGPEPCFNR